MSKSRSRARPLTALTLPPSHVECEAERRLIASEIADLFSIAVDASSAERQHHVRVAFTVGEYLAAVGRPGRWASIDIPQLMEDLVAPTDEAREDFCMTLAWMLGFLSVEGYLPPDITRRYIEAIARQAARPRTATCVRKAASSLPRAN